MRALPAPVRAGRRSRINTFSLLCLMNGFYLKGCSELLRRCNSAEVCLQGCFFCTKLLSNKYTAYSDLALDRGSLTKALSNVQGLLLCWFHSGIPLLLCSPSPASGAELAGDVGLGLGGDSFCCRPLPAPRAANTAAAFSPIFLPLFFSFFWGEVSY